MKKSATSHDVAREAGVSRTTVSYVLNNTGAAKISAVTREKVLSAAQKIGYFPNRAAKAIKTGHFGCIGLLLGKEIYLPKNLMLGINEAVTAEDMHLSVASLYRKSISEENCPAVLRHLIADGILVNCNEEMKIDVDDIKRGRKMPLIWLNKMLKNNCIYPDERNAAYDTTREILKMGHRRIMYVYSGYTSSHFSHEERLNGYRKAMRESGQSPQVYSTHQIVTDSPQRITQLCELLSKKNRPSAILTYSSYSALAVHTAALCCGLRIPSDLSLVTFEDDQKDMGTGYTINTLLVPWLEIGRKAVAQTLDALGKSGCNAPATAVKYSAFKAGGSCISPSTAIKDK